jgi:steroid delta-isomerase-like uncharacterized protein
LEAIMSAIENKANIIRLYEEVFKDWNVALIDELFSPSFKDHLLNRPGGGGATGPGAVHGLYDGLRSAFPDLTFEAHDIIAEEDKVVVRWSWNCTHLGNFRGTPATGRKARVEGIAVYRLDKGKIVERWVSTNLDALAYALREPVEE